jgi:HAD superfamily hydrolase (TIGR01549 family)
MPNAVIFDVDGTLVDSVDLHARAWQDAFHEFGHDLDFAKIRAQIGKGGDQLLPVFLSQEEIDEIGEQLQKRRADIFKERYLAQVRPFPMVRELFERLIGAGKRIALASSAKQDELQTYKDIANIADLLDTETSSDDADKSKPHPDIFQAALKRLDGMAPDQVIAVGDTPYDAEAAGKAAIRTIGFLCGGWSEEDLKKAGCVAVYDGPADLLARFDDSPLAASG